MNTANFFDWTSLSNRNDLDMVTHSVFSSGFYLDLKTGFISFTKKAALSIAPFSPDPFKNISIKDFSHYLTAQTGESFLKEVDLIKRDIKSASIVHVTTISDRNPIHSLIWMTKIPNNSHILGIFYGNACVMDEYNAKLELMNQELNKAQIIHNLIVEGACDYIYHLDLVNNTCTFSPHALKVLPLEKATFGNALETCLSFILPEDRSIFLNSFTPFLTGKSKYHKAEYRVRTKQGDIMWISCHGKGLHDEQGRPLVIAGSLLDITEKKKAEDHLLKMLYYDSLTGLKNRYRFDLDMEERFHTPGATGSIVYIDINNFKTFNDVFGHPFGNEVLKEFANILNLFASDSLGIYRLTSDEFVIHLPFIIKKEIMDYLTPLISQLKRPKIILEHNIYISTTMGIAIYPENGATAEEILRNADIAMYNAVKHNNESVTFFLDSNAENLSRRFTLENELRDSIDHNFKNFSVVYQPIAECRTKKWIGAEALLRFHSDTYGAIATPEIIELLEYTGLIVAVGRWVLEKACEECSKWQAAGLQEAVVHVNCSAIQINDLDFYLCVEQILNQYHLKPKNLICELTETSLIENFENALEFCNKLHDIGIGISLDDFGSGYSSLSYLRKLPIDEVKLDKIFAQQMKTDEFNRTIIHTVCTLAHSIQIEVCVEGVEDEEAWLELSKMNVDNVQGYILEKPIPPETFMFELLEDIEG